VDVTLLLWVDTKQIEELEKLFGINGAPLRHEVSTVGAPAPLGKPGFHGSVCCSRPHTVVADYLIP
jgi:hypothetical protein